HLKDKFPANITLPTPAEIFDATQCVRTGTNPNTSGEAVISSITGGPVCLNSTSAGVGYPGPGPDQIFGTSDDGQLSTIGSNLLSFVPTAATGTVNIAAANQLDMTNFHVKYD